MSENLSFQQAVRLAGEQLAGEPKDPDATPYALVLPWILAERAARIWRDQHVAVLQRQVDDLRAALADRTAAPAEEW